MDKLFDQEKSGKTISETLKLQAKTIKPPVLNLKKMFDYSKSKNNSVENTKIKKKKIKKKKKSKNFKK